MQFALVFLIGCATSFGTYSEKKKCEEAKKELIKQAEYGKTAAVCIPVEWYNGPTDISDTKRVPTKRITP